MEKTLILGFGNTIRGDDGIGIFVARSLKEEIYLPDIDVKETDEAGINLLDIITGYEKLIIIDSIQSEDSNVGDVYRFNLSEKNASNLFSSHGIGLPGIIKIGNALDIDLPKEIIIYAISIENSDSFTDTLSSRGKESISKAVDLIKKELFSGLKEECLYGNRGPGCVRSQMSSAGS